MTIIIISIVSEVRVLQVVVHLTEMANLHTCVGHVINLTPYYILLRKSYYMNNNFQFSLGIIHGKRPQNIME